MAQAKMTETRGWRRVVLPLSLVLNIFLVALIGGHVLRQQFREPNPVAYGPAGSMLFRSLARAESSLSPQDAAAFDAVIRRGVPRYAQAGLQLQAAREDLESKITAVQFDPQAVHQAFVAWQASWNRFVSVFEDTLVDALAQLSPEGRQRLVRERREVQAGLRAP